MEKTFDFDGEYGVRYERLAHQIIPGYAHIFPAGLALMSEAIGETADVLVVGAGTGVEIATFGAAQPGWRFTGVDPSGQMLAFARRRVEEEGIAARVVFHTGYVSDLDDAPRFDAATLSCVLHFLPDDGAKAGLVTEIARRLRPGAPLFLVDLHGTPETGEFERLMAGWRSYMALRGMTVDERRVFLQRLDEGMHYVPESRIVELLTGAGFDAPIRFYSAYLYGGWIATRR